MENKEEKSTDCLLKRLLCIFCNKVNDYKSKDKTVQGASTTNKTEEDVIAETVNIGNCTYKTIQIGSQVWIKTNLKTTTDRKGKSLIEGVDYFYPAGEKSNQGKYGLLYTWEAAKRCAPKGWRLPSDRDWRKLERTLGMNPQELLKYGGRGHIAEQLCDKDGKWKGSQEPSVPGKTEGHYKNAVDFSALPAGKFDGVEHKEFGESAYFWSSRRMIRNFFKKETWQGDFPNSSYFEWRFKLLKIFRLKKDAVYRSLHYNAASIFRHIEKTDVAFSVRYVKRKSI